MYVRYSLDQVQNWGNSNSTWTIEFHRSVALLLLYHDRRKMLHVLRRTIPLRERYTETSSIISKSLDYTGHWAVLSERRSNTMYTNVSRLYIHIGYMCVCVCMYTTRWVRWQRRANERCTEPPLPSSLLLPPPHPPPLPPPPPFPSHTVPLPGMQQSHTLRPPQTSTACVLSRLSIHTRVYTPGVHA